MTSRRARKRRTASSSRNKPPGIAGCRRNCCTIDDDVKISLLRSASFLESISFEGPGGKRREIVSPGVTLTRSPSSGTAVCVRLAIQSRCRRLSPRGLYCPLWEIILETIRQWDTSCTSPSIFLLYRCAAFQIRLEIRHYEIRRGNIAIFHWNGKLRRRVNSSSAQPCQSRCFRSHRTGGQRNEAWFIVDIHFPLTWDAIDR